MEKLVGSLLSKAGFYVFIERRSQGGNSLRVRVSSTPVKAPVDRIDYFFVLPGGLQPAVMDRIVSKTKVVGDVGTVTRCSPKLREREAVIVELPLMVRLKEMNCGAHEAEALAGAAVALLGLSADSVNVLLEGRVEDSEVSSVKTAFRLGHALGVEMDENVLVARYLRSDKKEILMDAGTAISLGTAAGGCNFVASHSLFSGTLFDFYADNSERFGTVAFRAEDGLGALNMCVGASYAGARALFAASDTHSVDEAIETAALSETPLVIHAVPGCGTMSCLGHGGLPHVVYAPVSVESAFTLGAQAFATAEKFRIPVVLMADPCLSEVAYDAEPSLPDGEKDNIPEGLPGLVLKTYTDKRVEKRAALLDSALPPKLFGDPDYRTLIVFWGFLQEILLEALHVAEAEGRFDTRSVAVL
ncbi:MAG: hypothetical protein LBJ22_03595, partial [Synergistaceae bacterium]|nr:hypothetical protein [Synergistaceae bacterium]